MIEEYLTDDRLRWAFDRALAAVGKPQIEVMETMAPGLYEALSDYTAALYKRHEGDVASIAEQIIEDLFMLLTRVRELGRASPVDPTWVVVIVMIIQLLYVILRNRGIL